MVLFQLGWYCMILFRLLGCLCDYMLAIGFVAEACNGPKKALQEGRKVQGPSQVLPSKQPSLNQADLFSIFYHHILLKPSCILLCNWCTEYLDVGFRLVQLLSLHLSSTQVGWRRGSEKQHWLMSCYRINLLRTTGMKPCSSCMHVHHRHWLVF